MYDVVYNRLTFLFIVILIRKYQKDVEGRKLTLQPKTVVVQIGDVFGTGRTALVKKEVTTYQYVKRVTKKQGMAFKKQVYDEEIADDNTGDSDTDTGIDTDGNASDPDSEPNVVEKFK